MEATGKHMPVDFALAGGGDPPIDNGLSDPADTDVAKAGSVDPAAYDAEEPHLLTDAERMRVLEDAVMRHPLNREILYKTLLYCQDERLLADVEAFILALPEAASATQNPYRMIQTLEKAYGLDRREYDGDGNAISPEAKIGMDEDEIDDLICSYSFVTTDLGADFVKQHEPRARIAELFAMSPERVDAFVELLEFIDEAPRSYSEICDRLKGHPALTVLIDGTFVEIQPSVFVDKLERSGALVWIGGWSLAEAGKGFLNDLKAS